METRVDPVGVPAEREVVPPLGQRYELLSLLGSGGMGTVYRAHDRILEEIVALKVVRRDVARSATVLERFR